MTPPIFEADQPLRDEPTLTAYVEHFQRRVMQDALAHATRAYWLRRAETFEWARPKAGDYTGQATPETLAALDDRNRDAAEACRRAAGVALVQVDVSAVKVERPEPVMV